MGKDFNKTLFGLVPVCVLNSHHVLSWRVSLEFPALLCCHVDVAFERVHLSQSEPPRTKRPAVSAAETLVPGTCQCLGQPLPAEPSLP